LLCATTRRTPAARARGQQVVGALGAQPVGGGDHALGAAERGRPAERGELVHDHLGLGPGDRAGDRLRVERVHDHRFGAQAREAFGPGRRPGGADDLVAPGDELGDQRGSDGAGRTGDEDPHDVSFPLQQETRRLRRP
jgi:hypothetical protein